MLTQERLRELLKYDPDTGFFFWRNPRHFNIKEDARAGSYNNRGYERILVDGVRYASHRLAWLYVYGEWPNIIDHINQNKSDNRITNLRSVPKSINNLNTSRAPGRYGRGVRKNWKRFTAQMNVDGVKKTLGTFDTPEEAQLAYQRAYASRFDQT